MAEYSSSASGQEMMVSEKIVVVSYSYKPSSNFFEAALKALFKCLGVEATPSATQQVSDSSPVATTETKPVDDDDDDDAVPAATAAADPAEADAPAAPAPVVIMLRATKPPLSTGSGGQIN